MLLVRNIKPARGATRHTWQQPSEVDAAAAVADSDAAEVVAAGTGACVASSSLLLLLLLLLLHQKTRVTLTFDL